LVFGIFDRSNGVALAWDEVVEWATLLNLVTVPVLWRGQWDEKFLRDGTFWESQLGKESEGYVVRLASSFSRTDFGRAVAKYVRKDHVQTDKHWMSQTVVPNKLAQ
ncbi:MAG: RNA ligase family protein, partial [Candidatus Uhrbacteria bacterium]